MISLSWSRFKIHRDCSLQYHLKYVQKVRLFKSNILFLVGSTVHDSVHNWTRQGYPQNTIKDITINLFDSLSKNFRITKERRLDLLKQSIKASIVAERLYRRLGIPEHNVGVEERFSESFGEGDRLIGIVDVLDLSVKAVYDLKNYSNDPTAYEEEQIYIYALAQQLKGSPVEFGGFITPLLDDKLHIFPVEESKMDELKSTLYESLVSMKGPSSMEPTTGNHCYFCDYYRTPHCPATYDRRGDEEIKAVFMDPAKTRKMMRKMNF